MKQGATTRQVSFNACSRNDEARGKCVTLFGGVRGTPRNSSACKQQQGRYTNYCCNPYGKAAPIRTYYPNGLNVIWKGESVLLTFKQKSEDSLYIPNFDKSIDNSNNIGFARISRAKRRKRVTRDMTTLKRILC
ncbi:uncharacterized protein TNCV_2033151 [Trichonephila clavipes]|nr:uncharacterized protein TNCV_2033151 [Trichonephila clavipes]